VLAGLVVAYLGIRGTLTGAAILGSGAVLAAAGSGALRDLRHRPAADHPRPPATGHRRPKSVAGGRGRHAKIRVVRRAMV